MIFSTNELKRLAAAGGSIVLDESATLTYSVTDLGIIAASLTNGASLTLYPNGNFSMEALEQISASKPGQVIFNFT